MRFPQLDAEPLDTRSHFVPFGFNFTPFISAAAFHTDAIFREIDGRDDDAS